MALGKSSPPGPYSPRHLLTLLAPVFQFGTTIGWAPPAGWTFTAWSELEAIENIDSVLESAVWWSPPTNLTIPSGSSITVKGWWPSISLPEASFTPDGTGSDGYYYDASGATVPDIYPADWLWVCNPVLS